MYNLASAGGRGGAAAVIVFPLAALGAYYLIVMKKFTDEYRTQIEKFMSESKDFELLMARGIL
jgi:hypothetical protein